MFSPNRVENGKYLKPPPSICLANNKVWRDKYLSKFANHALHVNVGVQVVIVKVHAIPGEKSKSRFPWNIYKLGSFQGSFSKQIRSICNMSMACLPIHLLEFMVDLLVNLCHTLIPTGWYHHLRSRLSKKVPFVTPESHKNLWPTWCIFKNDPLPFKGIMSLEKNFKHMQSILALTKRTTKHMFQKTQKETSQPKTWFFFEGRSPQTTTRGQTNPCRWGSRKFRREKSKILSWSCWTFCFTSWMHPGRWTWNLQITHLEWKTIFQTSMIMFHVTLHGCIGSAINFFLPRFQTENWWHPRSVKWNQKIFPKKFRRFLVQTYFQIPC